MVYKVSLLASEDRLQFSHSGCVDLYLYLAGLHFCSRDPGF